MKTLLKINIIVVIVTLVVAALPSKAETQCADDDEQCWQAVATAKWREENGDTPPNLTPEQEIEIHKWLIANYPNTDFNNP